MSFILRFFKTRTSVDQPSQPQAQERPIKPEIMVSNGTSNGSNGAAIEPTVTGKTGFASLKPSFVMKVNVGDASPVGEVSSGSNHYHFATNSGTIKSIPGSDLDLDLQVVFGGDWLYFDADKGRARVNLRGIAKDAEGIPVSFTYTGIALMNEHTGKIFSFSPEAKTIPFGSSTTIHSFEVGHPKYKALENKSWAGNGRFIVHPEGMMKGLTVESRVSELVASTDAN